MISKTELAWAAGLFDGEGHVRCAHGQARISISQTDPEVLERFKATVGMGDVFGPNSPTNKNARQFWVYRVQSFAKVQQVMVLLWSYLGSIKREQFKNAMLEARKPAKLWQKCASVGHSIGYVVQTKGGVTRNIPYCKPCRAIRRSTNVYPS